MAPSERHLIAKIHQVIERIYNDPAERENLTVRRVRNVVEGELHLDPGFFSQEQWKERSKEMIKEYAVCRGASTFSNVQ